MVQTLSMYEFLHRAISDYVDLYRNKDEEYEYSVPVGAVQANGTTKVGIAIDVCIRNQHSAWCIRLDYWPTFLPHFKQTKKLP